MKWQQLTLGAPAARSVQVPESKEGLFIDRDDSHARLTNEYALPDAERPVVVAQYEASLHERLRGVEPDGRFHRFQAHRL